MSLVCFDNHILVWGIKEQATLGQEDMIPRAKALIKHLDEIHDHILIPSVVVAEFLLPIPSEEHALVLNLFNRSFLVASFDTAAASIFAKIWRSKKEQSVIDALAKGGKTRTELRTDSQIVAIAVSQKAECIYSHDEALKSFAKDYIDVKEIPFIPQQIEAIDLKSQNTDWGKVRKDGWD